MLLFRDYEASSFNEELGRRPRVIRIFPNRAGYLRLLTGLAMEKSEDGITCRRNLDMRMYSEDEIEEEPFAGE